MFIISLLVSNDGHLIDEKLVKTCIR